MLQEYTRSIVSVLMVLTAFLLVGCGSGAADTTASTAVNHAADKQESSSRKELQKLNIDLSKAKDGVWTAESKPHEKLGTSKVELTIEDHKIIDAKLTGYKNDGTLKDDTYGEGKSEAAEKKAKLVLTAMKLYEKDLLEKQDPFRVDTISGATVSATQFREAAGKAIHEAVKE